jgi:predicted MFS family arabinose efflux permease
VLVSEEQRRTAYSLDSMGVELSFMAGPALGVVVATQVSTTAALLGVGVCMVVAGLALFAFDPPTRSDSVASAEPAAATESGGVRRYVSPGLVAALGAAAAATIVLAGTDVSIVAVLREHGAVTLTGLIFVFWGVGSMLGATVYGALKRPISPLLLLAGLAALTIPVGLAGSPWALALIMLPAGALCAPVVTATADEVARRVPERVRGEAMGWHGSALTIGNAIGAPLAGASIDAVAPWAGFAVVGGVGLGLALAGLGAMRLFGRPTQTAADADVLPAGIASPDVVSLDAVSLDAPARVPVAGVGELLDGEAAEADSLPYR